MVTASLPVVRAYRETLARLFDEPPTPLGLAGFIAARYTQEVLQTSRAAATRPTCCGVPAPAPTLDLGGFRISFQAQRRADGLRHAEHADVPTAASWAEALPLLSAGRRCYAGRHFETAPHAKRNPPRRCRSGLQQLSP